MTDMREFMVRGTYFLCCLSAAEPHTSARFDLLKMGEHERREEIGLSWM